MEARDVVKTRMTNGSAVQFTLVESTYPAGLRMPAHDHEPAYFSIVLKGTYTETSFRKTHTCKPATVVFHPPGDRHAVEFHNSDVRIFRVELKPRWLETIRRYPLMLETTHFHGGFLASLCRRLYGEFQRDDAYSPLAIEGLMLEITAEMTRQQDRKLKTAPPAWIKAARDLVHESISDPPSLEALARMVGVHPVSLAREFRRHYHCTIGEFVRRKFVGGREHRNLAGL